MEILKTKRLVIRELVPGDLDSLYSLYENGGDFISPMDSKREEERMKLESYIQYVYGFYGFGLWAVCDKVSGRLIGHCGLQLETIDGLAELELGYLIDSSCRRKGYGRECVAAILEYAKEMEGYERIILRIHKDNRESEAFAKAMGFEKSGLLRQDRKYNKYIYKL